MSDSTTTFLSATKPENFASEDTWGTKLNTDLDLFDAAIQALVEERNYATATGVDTIVVTLDPAPLSLTDGLEVRFKAAGANTVSPTLNPNGLGATAIKYPDGSTLAAGALVSGVIYQATYNSTSSTFIIGAAAAAPATAAETLTGTDLAKFLTAGGFAGNKTLAANGTYAFPGGFRISWYTTSTAITTESSVTATWTTAFANACVFAIAVPLNPAASSGNDGFLQTVSVSTTGAVFRAQDVGGSLSGFMALGIGY